MDIKLIEKGQNCPETDTLVVGLWKGDSIPESPVPDISPELGFESIIEKLDFKGQLGDFHSLTYVVGGDIKRIILVGLGDKDTFTYDRLRTAVNGVIREAVRIRGERILFNLIGHSSSLAAYDIIRLITEISLLSVYRFDKFKKEKTPEIIKMIYVYSASQTSESLLPALNEGLILGRAVSAARNLVNEPSNILTPLELANRTVEIGRESGFEVDVFDEKTIAELGMNVYLAVAGGSDNTPRLIVMRYRGNTSNEAETIALVGKGLTYDTGGLSIKTNAGMETMKRDMGGAASVIGAISAIARMGLKINVVGVVAACENSVSGHSYRPGDILRSMAGKTVYVANTDAEGRLTLIDAVHYAIEKEGADRVVDIATLTGAATQTLGYAADVVVGNDDDFYGELEKASVLAGEKKWRMPAFDEYKEQIKSDIAELSNLGVKPGAVSAGLFIGEFVQDKPWLHIDIAPSAWVDDNKDYRFKGGTGSGVRSLYYLAREIEAAPQLG